MQEATDIVLSAIRRGEDSLPKIKKATGYEYAQLEILLHQLEFEWRSIRRDETADGFARYYPHKNEKIGPAPEWYSVPPAATARTRASVEARDAALIQRVAPYCVKCRAVCLLSVRDRNGRQQWRCKPCNVRPFPGSSLFKEEPSRKMSMAHAGYKEFDKQAGVLTDDTSDEAGPTCVDCGKPRSIGSAERCRECYLKRADEKIEEIVGGRWWESPEARRLGPGRRKND